MACGMEKDEPAMVFQSLDSRNRPLPNLEHPAPPHRLGQGFFPTRFTGDIEDRPGMQGERVEKGGGSVRDEHSVSVSGL